MFKQLSSFVITFTHKLFFWQFNNQNVIQKDEDTLEHCWNEFTVDRLRNLTGLFFVVDNTQNLQYTENYH